MRIYSRLIFICFLTTFALVACTRDRPTPEPTATTALPAAPTVATSSGADPVVQINTPEAGTPTPEATLSAEAQSFDYRVLAGDTIASIAEKFGTDVATVRRLNFLSDDNIFAGQILRMPIVAGVAIPGGPTPTPAPFRYTIAAGDTLAAIGERFGVDPVKIVEANNLLTPDSLVVGQELVIPGYEAPVSTSGDGAGGVIHVVQAGEGLGQIAEKYGVTTADIIAANSLTNPDLLQAGQKLVIPGVSAEDAALAGGGAVHTVQAGESLLSIAVQYGITANDIVQANNLTNPDAIYVGQKLIIPGQ